MAQRLLPYALQTLAELKAQFLGQIDGAALDDPLILALNQAALEIEGNLGRRVVFRAPTESAASIVASVAAATGALTIAAQPTAPGRFPVVTLSAPLTLTAGTLTLTGTIAGATGTLAIDLSAGVSPLYGTSAFSAYSAASLAGIAGTSNISIGSSIGYLDYYTPPASGSIWLADWPVRQVVSLHEDTARVFADASLLVDGTDWLLGGAEEGRPRGTLVNLSGWASGWRSVRMVDSAGWGGIAAVPGDLKSVAGMLAKMYFDVGRRPGDLAVSSRTNAAGTYTRFGPAGINEKMQETLDRYKNWASTADGVRGFDLEGL